MQSEMLTAAIIIIGNEILSGKTQDQNIQFIALELGNLGIKLKEVRVIPDIEEEIITIVNALRKKHTYIFTTGGIGPTHDDITAESISKAFNDKYILHPEAKNIIDNHLSSRGRESNQGHLRMAHMPKSATPLLNRETGAPGFKVENVFVMAGVPYIMRAMFEEAKKFLNRSNPIISKSIETFLNESNIASDFSRLQDKYPEIEMGSYPSLKDGRWSTSLVLRGNDSKMLEQALGELEQLLFSITQEQNVTK